MMCESRSDFILKHLLSDVPVAVGLLASGVGRDGDVNAVEDGGLVPTGLESAPA